MTAMNEQEVSRRDFLFSAMASALFIAIAAL